MKITPFPNKSGQKESYAPDIPSKRFLPHLYHQRAFLYTTLLLTFIALLLRLYRLGAFELWLDEAYTYRQTVIVDWLGSLLRDNSPPFYNLLMRGWCSLFGSSEFVLRLPSAIFGTLFIPVVCYAGREIFSPRAGFYSGLVSTLSPIHLHYSQEARNYTLLLLLLLLSVYFLVRAARDDRRLDWWIAILSALLALFTHYLAGLALLPLVVIVLTWSPAKELRKRLITFCHGVIFVLFFFIPWVVWSFWLTEHSFAGFDWMIFIWKNLPPILALPRTVEAFTLLTGPHILLSATEFGGPHVLLPEWLILPVRICIATASFILLLPYCEEEMGVCALRRKKWALLILFFTPLLLLWGMSYIRPLYIVSRYDMIAYPSFVLLTGLFFTKVEAIVLRQLFQVLLLLWILISVWAVYNFHSLPADSYKMKTAEFLRNRVLPGDVVIFTGNRSYVTRYYLSQMDVECRNWRCTGPDGTFFPYRRYPTANEDEEAVYNDDEVMADPKQVSKEVDEFLSMRKSSVSSLWIVLKGRIFEDNSLLLKYLPDSLFLDELGRRKIPCNLASSELTIFICRER